MQELVDLEKRYEKLKQGLHKNSQNVNIYHLNDADLRYADEKLERAKERVLRRCK